MNRLHHLARLPKEDLIELAARKLSAVGAEELFAGWRITVIGGFKCRVGYYYVLRVKKPRCKDSFLRFQEIDGTIFVYRSNSRLKWEDWIEGTGEIPAACARLKGRVARWVENYRRMKGT